MFTTQIVDSKPMITCWMVLQHNNIEPLLQYMAQFSKATLNILNFHPTMAMHVFTVALHPMIFLNSLYANPLVNMDALRARADIYINS